MSAPTVAPTPGERSAGLRVDLVPVGQWHERCAVVLAAEGRFLALYGADRGVASSAGMPVGRGVCALFAEPTGTRLLAVAAPDGAVPSIVDVAPAAGWDEREAHDSY